MTQPANPTAVDKILGRNLPTLEELYDATGLKLRFSHWDPVHYPKIEFPEILREEVRNPHFDPEKRVGTVIPSFFLNMLPMN